MQSEVQEPVAPDLGTHKSLKNPRVQKNPFLLGSRCALCLNPLHSSMKHLSNSL